MTKRAKLILLALPLGLLMAAFVLVRSITVRLTIPDETVAATGDAATVIGVVIAAILTLLILVWLFGRVRISACAVAPMQSSVPAPVRREAAPSKPMSYGARKVFGALALGLIVFTSTYITFGSVELAALPSLIFVVCVFNIYDKLDTSMDNLLGGCLVLFLVGALVLLLVPVGGMLAGMVGANPPVQLLVVWAVSIPVAVGIHSLICCAGRTGIRAEVGLPSHKRGIVVVGIVLALIALAIALWTR